MTTTNAAAEVSAGTRVEFEKKGRVATVRLVSDAGPPLLTSPVLGELGTIVERLATDPCVRYVVFRSTGKVFCAGADLQRITNITEDQGYSLSRFGTSVMNAIENLPQITFAAINGHAMAGGCELALACSFRLMVSGALIGTPQVRFGLIPGWGATRRLPMIVPLSWALRMLYSGEAISAEQAEKIGLVDEVVPTEGDLDEALDRWFEMFKESAPRAIIRIKKSILDDDESHQFGLCFTCDDAKEGMQAFLEKRKPSWVTEECSEGQR